MAWADERLHSGMGEGRESAQSGGMHLGRGGRGVRGSDELRFVAPLCCRAAALTGSSQCEEA